MPKVVSEITPGAQYTKSRSDQQGQTQDNATRVFRVLLNSPGEIIDPQEACGISIGSAHPTRGGLSCTSADVRYDGESRMAAICTFQYQGENAQQQDKPPGEEQASWSMTSSLIEHPVYSWRMRSGLFQWGATTPAKNAAGDMYDAITKLTPIINISISQRQVGDDPTSHLQNVGFVNEEEITIGSLVMVPHTVMFRGLQAQPFVTDWRGTEYRGWQCTYEFAYKPNETSVIIVAPPAQDVPIGWDIAVPQTGFNCLAWYNLVTGKVPPNNPDKDQFGQPLAHKDGRVFIDDNGNAELPENTFAGDRVRGMVKVFSYEDKGVSQAPSASPIPLNDDGSPRKESANPKVLVFAYAVQEEINFTREFRLRLQ